jgi:hypothetical protein
VELPGQDPEPLPYLSDGESRGLDIDVEVVLNGAVVSRPPYSSMYWSPAQMLAHLTVTGPRFGPETCSRAARSAAGSADNGARSSS